MTIISVAFNKYKQAFYRLSMFSFEVVNQRKSMKSFTIMEPVWFLSCYTSTRKNRVAILVDGKRLN